MKGLKATVMMIVCELIMSGFTVFYKLASNDGMLMCILIAYRYLFASVLIFPLSFFMERKRRPKLTWRILFNAFLCAIFGGPLAQNLYSKSIVLTSATFATTFTNLITPFTFIVAVLFRLEKVEISKISGKAKVIGTLLGVGGAMLLTLYKGRQLDIWSTHFNILHGSRCHVTETRNTTSAHHIIGSVLSLTSSLSVSFNFIFQSKLNAMYPCVYSSTSLISIMGFILSFVYTLCTERSWSQWKLCWNVRLLAIGYMGLGSASTTALVMECMQLKGPVFVSNFNPLMLVFVAVAGLLVLGETLHLGLVLGSIIIIVGLYVVIWGKGKEAKMASNNLMYSRKDLNDVSNMTTTTTTQEIVCIA